MTRRVAFVKMCAFAAALMLLSAADAAARTINLSWDASADPVAGYRVYWSTQPGIYSDDAFFDVGNSLTWTGDLPGDQYYFVIRAYDAEGTLGPSSLEVGDTSAFWLSNPGDQSNEAGQVVALSLLAHGAIVTFGVDGLPDGLGIDAISGQVFGTVTAQSAFRTTRVVTARAVDALGHVSSVQFYWTISTPQAPVALNPGGQVDAAGDTINLPIDAVDPDGGTLRYSAAHLPTGLEIGATTGIISGTIAPTAAGVFDASVAISDGRFTTTVRFAWHILTPDSGLTVDGVVSAEWYGRSLTSAPFSTTLAGETLIAFVATAQPTSEGALVSGGGLEWSFVTRAKQQAGTAEIWTARAPARLSNVTVTTETTSDTFLSLTVVSFAGADGVGASAAASAATGAPAVSLTTTRAGSFVFGVGNDWDGSAPRTMPAGQQIVHEAFGALGDTFWVQRVTDAIPAAATTVTVNATEPIDHQWNLAAVEIRARPQVAPTSPNLTIDDVSGGEGDVGSSAIIFTVRLSAPSAVPVSVNYATIDGTARAGADYMAQSGILVFTPGTTQQTIAVSIAGDKTDESNESFSVMLSGASKAVLADERAFGTIVDDDGSAKVENQMFGFGAFPDGPLRDRFVFRVADRKAGDYTRLEFWSSEPGKGNGKGLDPEDRAGSSDKDFGHDHRTAKNRFESTIITSAVFGPGDKTGQTVILSGGGLWNGKAGYTFEARAADRGEPGRGRDTFALIVKDSLGTVVLNINGTIDEGNIQATPSKAQPMPTFKITGTLSPAALGKGATVTLKGGATSTTTTDANGAYTFNGLSKGQYTVTPSKPSITFSSTSTAVTITNADATTNFTATQVVGPTIDAAVSVDRSNKSTRLVASGVSTTAGNELVLAFIAADDANANPTSVTGVTGGGLTWVLAKRTNKQRGTSEIWRAFAPSVLTNISITATLAQSAAASMTVMSFKGVDTSGTNGSVRLARPPAAMPHQAPQRPR